MDTFNDIPIVPVNLHERIMFYNSLSKFKLVQFIQTRDKIKYPYYRTKQELVKLLMEIDKAELEKAKAIIEETPMKEETPIS